MKIGLIMKAEKYWSLQKLNENVWACLQAKYEIIPLFFDENGLKDQIVIDNLYRDCNVVIYMASKLTVFKRPNDKPTFFFTYAWMDHGAGINFFVNQSTFKRQDVLLFSSSAARNKFHHVYQTNLRSEILPYFTTDHKLELNTVQEEDLKIKYQLPLTTKLLIYFGRLAPDKNIEALFILAEKIKNKDFTILVIGDYVDISTFGFGISDLEKYKSNLTEVISANKSNQLVFINQLSQSDLNQLIAISYLAVNLTTCREENFSLSTIEALAAGLPVVASHWGGLKDIISNKVDGYLVPVDFSLDQQARPDVDAAASDIDSLLVNESQQNKLSVQAYKKFKSKFSAQAFLSNIDRLLIESLELPTSTETIHIYPQDKYLTVYVSALEQRRVGTIYLDNPWLFQDLYKYYL